MNETVDSGGPESPYQRQLRVAAGLEEKNRRLAEALVQARGQLSELRRQVAGLSDPPGTYALFERPLGDGTALVSQQGRRLRVAVGPKVDVAALAPGQTVALNQNLALVGAGGFERVGTLAQVAEVLSEDRIMVVTRGEDQHVVARAGSLRGAKLRLGDAVVADLRSGFAFEVVARSHAQDLAPSQTPDVDYADIGGLAGQLEQIRDAIELPFAHPDLYAQYGLRAPKGVLLYGPPGCGKTLIAKAVAKSLADKAPAGGPATFISVKGPELLNKYVGETERHIRAIFARARERAAAGGAVVVFFDEMEALFRTRGTGISSDVENTVVPQLLAEIDGVETQRNVIVIGASNREEMIDPAILRPGRLDVKVRIDRPDQAAAVDILGKYLLPSLPIAGAELAAHGGDAASAAAAMAKAVAARLYSTEPANRFLEVTYAGGDKEVLFHKDFASGAMIKAVVDRAKKAAIKQALATGEGGLSTPLLLAALAQELAQNEDLPGTTNPDDWARVSGRKGERIVYLRTLARGGRRVEF